MFAYQFNHGIAGSLTEGDASETVVADFHVINDVSEVHLPDGLGWRTEVAGGVRFQHNRREILPNGRLRVLMTGSMNVRSWAESGLPRGEQAAITATYSDVIAFTITQTEEISFRGSIILSPDLPSPGSILLQRLDGGMWTDLPLDNFGEPGGPDDLGLEGQLTPGDYLVVMEITLASDTAEEGGELDVQILLSFGIGPVWEGAWPPPTPTVPIEGHSHPLYYSVQPVPETLSVGGIVVTDLSFLGRGITELVLGLQLINNSGNPWEQVLAEIPPAPGSIEVEVVAPEGVEDGLGFTNELRVRVASGDAAALLSELAANDRIRLVRGRERITFSVPVYVWLPGEVFSLDYISQVSNQPHNVYFTRFPDARFPVHPFPSTNFYSTSNPPAGEDKVIFPPQLWLMDPRMIKGLSSYREETGFDLTSELAGHWMDLPAFMPDEANPILEENRKFFPSDFPFNSVGSGSLVTLADYVLNGAFSFDLGVNPDSTESSSQADRDKNGRLMLGLPIHFNKIRIKDMVDLSGSFKLSPQPLRVDVDFRGAQLQHFLVETGIRADANLLLEITAPVENLSDPVIDQEVTFFSAPLFSVPLPLGLTVTPVFSLKAGASVDATRQMTIPFTAGVDTKVRLGSVRGENGMEPFYEETAEPTPPGVSDPQVFDAIHATASAWLGADLEIRFKDSTAFLDVGPRIGAKVAGEFSLRPFSDPWWRLAADLEISGGVEFQLFGFLTLFDDESVLTTLPLFEKDAGGPLFPGMAPMGDTADTGDSSLNPGLKPITGGENRWIRGLRNRQNDGSYTRSFLIELADGDLLQGGSASSGFGHVARYDRQGGLRWLRQTLVGTTLAPRMVDAVAEPDGGYTMVSNPGFRIALARFNADGEPIWNRNHDVRPGLLLYASTHLAHILEADGQPAYLVLGAGNVTSSSPSVPVLSKFDAEGNWLWTRLYETDQGIASSFHAALLTGDGHLVAAGQTAHLPPEEVVPPWSSPARGLLMKIDPEVGEVVWATIVPGGRGIAYRALAEDPEGNLYAGGNLSPVVTDGHGSKIVSRFSAEGDLEDSVTFGRVPRVAELLGESGNDAILTPIPHEHRRFWDEIRDMTWMDGAVWVVGKKGLGEESSAFLARLNRDLGVSRYVHYSGTDGADAFDRVIAMDDGVGVAGSTRSLLPWPRGRDGSALAKSAHLLARLPREAMVRFHERSTGHPVSTGGAPDRGTFFVYPEVMKGESVSGGGIPYQGAVFDATGVFASVAVALVESAPVNTPQPAPPFEYRALESAPFEMVDDFDTYRAWYQLDPDTQDGPADTDNDGIPDALEFFFGLDPWRADAPPPITATIDEAAGTITLGFPRGAQAGALGIQPILQTSPDLQTWEDRFDALFDTQSWLPDQDWGRLTVPLPDGDPVPSRFFMRFRLP